MNKRIYSKYQGHSVTSAPVELQIDNNGTWEDAFQFGEPDDMTWDLLGQTFEMDVQRNPYDAVPLLSLSTGNGRIITDSAILRVIHFKVDADDIQSSLKPGTYVYDLVMIYEGDIRVPLMHGAVQVVQGVTYPPTVEALQALIAVREEELAKLRLLLTELESAELQNADH